MGSANGLPRAATEPSVTSPTSAVRAGHTHQIALFQRCAACGIAQLELAPDFGVGVIRRQQFNRFACTQILIKIVATVVRHTHDIAVAHDLFYAHHGLIVFERIEVGSGHASVMRIQ